jgi:hypothetical protein
MRTVLRAVVAIVMALAMLGAFALSAPAASAADKVADVVVTEKVDLAFDIEKEDLYAVLEMIPLEDLERLAEEHPCLLRAIEEWDDEVITVALDGMVHVNLKAWEKKGCLDVKLQAFWHGDISISIDGEEVLALEFRNLQIVAHVTVSECSLERVILNAHLNAEISSLPLDLEMDLKAHLLLHYVNGELHFKIWLPDLLDLPVCDA